MKELSKAPFLLWWYNPNPQEDLIVLSFASYSPKMPDDFLREYFLFICVVSSRFVTCISDEARTEPHVHSVDPTARNRNLISTTRLKQTKQFQLSAFPVSYFFLSVCLKIKENLEIFSLRFDRFDNWSYIYFPVYYTYNTSLQRKQHSRVTLPRWVLFWIELNFCQELEKIYAHSILWRRQHHSTFLHQT